MPNFYYTDTYGQKHGLFNEEQLKSLVAQGIITPYTPLETEGGHKGLAEQIPGLFDSVLPPFAYVPPITPYIVPISPVDKIKRLNTLFMGFWICVAVSTPFVALYSFLTDTGTMFCDGSGSCGHRFFEVGGLTFFLAFPIIITGWIFGAILIYRLWEVIPAEIARTTPGKAVGLSFIPFFGLYWIFVAYKGLSEDMNKTLQWRGIPYQVDRYTGLLFCLLTILVWFNVCALAAPVIAVFFFKSVKDGAIALLEQEEHSHTRTI